jgi:exoribonuclease R
MLPAELSTDLTSLLDAQDRISIIIELHILDSGDVKAHDVYPAWLRNRAKLAYSSTGAWLEGRAPIPPAVANVPGMEVQLRLQRRHRKSCAASASYTERSHSSRSKPRRCCKMAK